MSYVTIDAADGGTFQAYHAAPTTPGPAPGIVLIQEIFGVNKVMRDLADQYAGLGYQVLCPDIFWRIKPGIDITDQSKAEWDRAFELFGLFDTEIGVSDLISTLGHLRRMASCSGKAASVGYCLGGKLAYLMATRSDTDCNVSYYGVGIDALLGESAAIQAPYLCHVAAKDGFVPPDAQARILAGLADNPFCSLHVYDDRDHAFARVGGEHYDRAAADLANTRTADFFKTNLS